MEIIKYYKPKVKEFKIGFEYQCFHKLSGKWYNHKLVEEDLQKEPDGTWIDDEVCPYSKKAKLRVKYPSDFDFRKLGFPHDRYRSTQFLGITPRYSTFTVSRGDISISVPIEIEWKNYLPLNYWYNPKGILYIKRIIITEEGHEDYNYLFEGKINNMFELKQKLKELKIDYCA